MSGGTPYGLSIEIIFPTEVIENSIFKVTYKIKNIDKVTFPGGTVGIKSYVHLNGGKVLLVNHSIQIGKLEPNGIHEESYNDIRAIAGITVFLLSEETFRANDGWGIEMYLPDRRRIVAGQLIGFLRAKSREEMNNAKAMRISAKSMKSSAKAMKISAKAMKIGAASLVALVVIQIVDWAIRYYLNF